MKTLGQTIRELREKKDLSLRELAKKLGVTAAFLSDIELGRRFPSEKVFSNMAKELGTPLEDLRSYDTRAPLEDLRRLANSNPLYGIAFRKLIDKEIPPEELMKFVDTKKKS